MQLGLHRLAQPRSPTSSLGVCHFNPQRYDQRPSYSAAQRLAPGCSTYPWVSKSGRKQQPSQATAELSSGVPIDRGAGGHHPPPPIKHTGGDGGQEPEGAAADDALAKVGDPCAAPRMLHIALHKKLCAELQGSTEPPRRSSFCLLLCCNMLYALHAGRHQGW